MEEDHATEFTPKVKEYISLIKGRVVRAENLIGGILSYARVDKEVLPKEVVDIKELLFEVIDTTVLDRNLRVEIGNMPTYETERIPLTQVFSNLISNAAKYHDKPDGKIWIRSADEGDHFRFFVEDNGPGISSQYHKKIFQIFQTLHEGNGIANTGVGLAIVKKILDERNQTIDIQSEPGKGTVFSFTWAK
jgi:signal transduction histidine kinase